MTTVFIKPPLTMARQFQSPPTKYVPAEWHAANNLQYTKVENERAFAERLRDECARIRKETDAITRKTQESVCHKFSQRLRDIEFWKEELQKKLADNSNEIQSLLQSKQSLEVSLRRLQHPLEVTQMCLLYREKRVSVDNVHDEVEIQLIKEMEVIQGIQTLIQQMLEQVVEQIRLMKACKYRLEKDFNDKLGAQDIDYNCARFTETTPGVGYAQDAVKIQTHSITPEQWETFSNDNILKAEQERTASVTLRGIIQSVLDQTKQDLVLQRTAVNLAFEKRIQEISTAKETLEKHLRKVLEEAKAMEENVELHTKTLEAKEGPLQLAQTRLKLRASRPNQELVRDPVQYGLVEEVGQIQTSIQQLKSQLAESGCALKALTRTEDSLREEIEVKANSLHIDKDECMALRTQLELS